jgi:serine protease Do
MRFFWRSIRSVFVFFLLLFIVGCAGFSIEFSFTTTSNTSVTQTTLPSTIEGTISIGDSEYNAFEYYDSPTYRLSNIDDYNAILLATRDKARRANIELQTTVYRMVALFPGSKTMVEQVIATSSGSGVIYKSDATYYYAITNFHVIDPETYSARYEVQTFDSTLTSSAELLAYQEEFDLAVIRFPKAARTEIHEIDIDTRKFTKIVPGELVIAVGNPETLTYNVTFGEFIRMTLIENAEFKVIYHSATIHEGSSGGALLDVDGNLLGINTWGSQNSDEDSFAVPVHIIYMFLVNNDLL